MDDGLGWFVSGTLKTLPCRARSLCVVESEVENLVTALKMAEEFQFLAEMEEELMMVVAC